MNSSGDITECVVPSRRGGLELEHHPPGSVGLHESLASAGLMT